MSAQASVCFAPEDHIKTSKKTIVLQGNFPFPQSFLAALKADLRVWHICVSSHMCHCLWLVKQALPVKLSGGTKFKPLRDETLSLSSEWSSVLLCILFSFSRRLFTSGSSFVSVRTSFIPWKKKSTVCAGKICLRLKVLEDASDTLVLLICYSIIGINP